MTSTQSCLKTVEVEQLVDRLTRCDSLHGIVPNVPNDRLNEGGLHYLYAGARANVHLAWLLHQSFLSTTWRGLWAMRLHQSLLRIGIAPHKLWFQFIFSLFRSADGHFVVVFFLVVVGG